MIDTILLIEAHAGHARAIQTYLKAHHMQVQHVPTLDAARKTLQLDNFTTVIIDLNVNDEKAIPFMEWLQANPRTAQSHHILLAGKQQAAVAREIQRLFDKPLLMKPFQMTDLLLRIRDKDFDGLLATDREEKILNSLIGRMVGSAIIMKEVGRGGMGAVYLGKQKSLGRQVAVKLLLPSLVGDQKAADRFRREAQAIARLKSPHIVQIFDFDHFEKNLFYIIMEFLPGPTLERLLRSVGKLPVEHSVSLILQIAQGLSTAHEADMVHRDIKPSNLILDEKGRVTITDFGLVRPVSVPSSTQTGLIIGTPNYMAPEQISGAEVDARTDIYSLGIVFYQLLTARLPFTSPNPMEIMVDHTKTPLPDPRRIAPDIPPPVVRILKRMTDKHPSRRFHECHHLITELENLNLQLPEDSWTLKPDMAASRTQVIEDSDYQGGGSGSSTGVKEMIPPSMIEDIQKEMASVIGPIASVVLGETARDIGYPLPDVPMQQVETLIERLLERVETDKRPALQTALQNSLFEHRRKQQ